MNISKFFKDSNGKIVLIQRPNIPLIVWLVGSVAGRLITEQQTANDVSRLASGALIVWGLMELTQGVNYFRRFLGAVAVLFTLVQFF